MTDFDSDLTEMLRLYARWFRLPQSSAEAMAIRRAIVGDPAPSRVPYVMPAIDWTEAHLRRIEREQAIDQIAPGGTFSSRTS